MGGPHSDSGARNGSSGSPQVRDSASAPAREAEHDEESIYQKLRVLKRAAEPMLLTKKASVAKVLKKMQVLRATQEQEPVLIGCGLTLVQTEAILDKKECSKSCLRFHRSSSGYWDCYFYQDPHIEHEATRGGISNAWWDGLRQIPDVGPGLSDYNVICDIGTAASPPLETAEGGIIVEPDNAWLHWERRQGVGNARRVGAVVSEVGHTQSLPALFRKSLEWFTAAECEVVILTKIYARGTGQNGLDSLEPNLEVYTATRNPDGQILFQGPTILGDTSSCTGPGQSGYQLHISLQHLVAGTSNAWMSMYWLVLDLYRVRSALYRNLRLDCRQIGPAPSGVNHGHRGRQDLERFCERNPTCIAGPIVGGEATVRHV